MSQHFVAGKASSMSEPCPHSAGFLGSKFQRVFKNITNPERPELGRSVNGRGSSQQGFSSVSIGARFSGLS